MQPVRKDGRRIKVRKFKLDSGRRFARKATVKRSWDGLLVVRNNG